MNTEAPEPVTNPDGVTFRSPEWIPELPADELWQRAEQLEKEAASGIFINPGDALARAAVLFEAAVERV